MRERHSPSFASGILRGLHPVTLFAALLLLAAIGMRQPSASAQGPATFKGTGSCAGAGNNCHRPKEIPWLTQQEGGKQHNESLKTLRSNADKSQKYAKAVNIQNVEDPAGMCIKCHGTPIGPSVDGVGCERCHGPSSGYLEVHSKEPKDGYTNSVKAGMRDLKKQPQKWAPVCKDCHVLTGRSDYTALVKARHPSGAEWVLSESYEGVSKHWKNVKYTAEVISPFNGPGGGVGAPPPVATPPETKPESKPETKTETKTETPDSKPAIDSRPPEPKEAPVPRPPARNAVPSRADRTSPGPDPNRDVPPVRTADVPPALPQSSSPLTLQPPPPVTPSGMFAALQDRVSQFLESLLRRGAAPSQPLEVPTVSQIPSGPDADLLRAQAEALALAVEALNLRSKATASPGKK